MARNSIAILLLWCTTALCSLAQVNRHVVFFKDKAGTSFVIDRPNEFLSTRSLERRRKNAVAVTEEDLPVTAGYLTQLRQAGANVFFASRWFNAALVEATDPVMQAVATLPFVMRTERVAPGSKLSSGKTRQVKNRKESGIAPETLGQLSMLGIDAMHTEGIRGEGVWVAVFDSGFEGVNISGPFQHLINGQQIKDAFDFVGNTRNVFQYDDHGTEVFSVISARSATFTGGAFNAQFSLFVTEDVSSEYRIEEFNWLLAAERADSAGADIIQSSLGYNIFDDATMNYPKSALDGEVALVSRAAREALDRGIMVVASAGNEGNNNWRLVTPPADVAGVLAVGSITSGQTRSSFSSVGPTADGRIKPDVVALGSGTQVVRPNGNNGFTSGTSVAAPLITSLAAGLLQRFPDLTVSALYNLITGSASQSANPDNVLGYGLPNYGRAVKSMLPYQPEEEITIFPNPTTGTTQVLLKEAGQQVSISVHDVQGRPIYNLTTEITWRNNPLEINTSDWPAGMYLMTVRTSNSSKTEKLVKN